MTRYRVTGTTVPDCTTSDTGESMGTVNGQPQQTWTNDAGTWYLNYGTQVANRWKIGQSAVAEELGNPFWLSAETPRGGSPLDVLVGDYSPTGATGTATVSEVAASVYATLTVNDGPLAGQYIVLKTG